jgi:hypothetical protein
MEEEEAEQEKEEEGLRTVKLPLSSVARTAGIRGLIDAGLVQRYSQVSTILLSLSPLR